MMTQPVICCSPDANVGTAAQLMWEHDCGFLPVVGADHKLAGVVTDRDICIAIGTRNRLPGELTLGEIATKKVFVCKPDDDIHEALDTIAKSRVRRLPVVNEQGVPLGLLSMDDIVTHGDLNKWEGCCDLSSEEIVRCLKKLYGQKLPVVRVESAAA